MKSAYMQRMQAWFPNAYNGAGIIFLASPCLRAGSIEATVLYGPLPWVPHRRLPRQAINVTQEYGGR
jgi:hypothetical protein